MIIAVCSCESVNQDSKPENSTQDYSSPNTSDDNRPVSGNNIENIFSHDAVECLFYSVEDLETYLYTGSVQSSDYTNSPEFENFPQIDGYKTNEYALSGYVSLETVFGLNLDEMDEFESVSFQITSDCVVFNYHFKHNYITVTYSPGCFSDMTTTEYYAAYCDYASIAYSSQNFSVSENIDTGYVLRRTGEKEVVYTYRNGIPRMAGIMMGNYFISVTTASSSDAAEAYQQYTAFMNSDTFGSVASIFSTDSTKFESSITKVEQFDKLDTNK